MLVGARPLDVPFAEALPESLESVEPCGRSCCTGQVVEEERTVNVRDAAGGELVMHYVLSPVGAGPPYPGVLATSLDVTRRGA